MSPERRRLRDLIAVSLFAVLIAFLFWPSGGNDPETDAGPEGDAAFETPTPEVTATPVAQEELACDTDDSTRLLNEWVSALNSGEQEALAGMLPIDGSESPSASSYPGMDQTILHSFTVHESGTMSHQTEVLDYLSVRHQEQNEQWHIDDLELQRLDGGIQSNGVVLDRATVQFTRSAEDLPTHEIDGTIVLNCSSEQVVLVDLYSDEPDLALSIGVNDFLAAVGPYGTGEMRDLRMLVSTDIREDTGALTEWEISRFEANASDGTFVSRINVETLDGDEILDYGREGTSWHVDQRGWQESGDASGWGVLPLELMLTRAEPTITADVLINHLDDIPHERSATFTDEFEIRDELQQAANLVLGTESVEGIIEVEVEDGNLVRTSHRLIDRQLGIQADVAEIDWLHIHRRDRYDPELFIRPFSIQSDEQQFSPPRDLSGDMELVERLDHADSVGERFLLEWEGEDIELLVRPSRGESHGESRGDDWPTTWGREHRVVDDHSVVLAGPDGDAFPEAALWDTGLFRYELRVNSEHVQSPENWDAVTMMGIAEVLIDAERSRR